MAEPGPARLLDEPWGDSARLFTAVGGTSETRWQAALDLHRRLFAAQPAVVEDWIHAFESVLVTFDCALTDGSAIASTIDSLLAEPRGDLDSAAGRHFEVPVLFGNAYGPDLLPAATEVGMTSAALVEYLTSGDLTIGTVGGNLVPLMQRPGQPFSVSRMPSPRTVVPAGSLGLAGDRTCFYPVEAPGGWRLVGRTPVRLIDPSDPALAPYTAGDTVRLRAIDVREWEAIRGDPLRASDAGSPP